MCDRKDLNRQIQNQEVQTIESSTDACKLLKLESMIVNHNSIDLTLHSRSTSSELNSLKENIINPDKMNILRSKELENINGNVMNICKKSETPENKLVSEKSVSNLSLPFLSQAANLCSKPLSETYMASLPPVFHRYYLFIYFLQISQTILNT